MKAILKALHLFYICQGEFKTWGFFLFYIVNFRRKTKNNILPTIFPENLFTLYQKH